MPTLNTYFKRNATISMYPSYLKKRISLAKIRAKSYPLDSMDFIMMDLERPESLTRHADFCTGDLTGRYLDFLSATMEVDETDRERLDELFQRILKCRTKDGTFGDAYNRESLETEHDKIWGTGAKHFIGLIRYYLWSGNVKALDAAIGNAEYFLSHKDCVYKLLEENKKSNGFDLYYWIVEPLAMLYGIVGDQRYIDVIRKIEQAMPESICQQHSHGLMTVLRGFQLAAIYTGDKEFNDLPEKFRKEIEKDAVWVDGNIPEIFPVDSRNEGCSIADWIMLNLYSGFITGNPECYELAENAMFNALSLNQTVNGGFGHRMLKKDKTGYLAGHLSQEAWWCCLHNAGLSLIEYARHAVTMEDKKVFVNLLLPGKYTFDNIEVTITTNYPQTASALITVKNAGDVSIRIPSFVKNAEIKESNLPNNTKRYSVTGDMGYYLVDALDGVALKYGPLIMVPLNYFVDENAIPTESTSMPKEYVPKTMTKDQPAIIVKERDEKGFVVFEKEPNKIWKCYEEGFASELAFDNLSINVPLCYPNGSIVQHRFYPMLYSTTSTIGTELPLVFNK